VILGKLGPYYNFIKFRGPNVIIRSIEDHYGIIALFEDN